MSRKKESLLRERLSENPEDQQALLELSHLLASMRSSKALVEASTLARQALSLNPNPRLAYLQLAKIELKRRNIDEAERLAHKAIAIDPEAKEANAILGLCCIARLSRIGFTKTGERAFRLELYEKAYVYFQNEKELDVRFKPPHSKMAGQLWIGRLRRQANQEAILSIRNGQVGLGALLVMLLTFWMNAIFWLSCFLFVSIAVLLTPVLSVAWTGIVAGILTVCIIALSFVIRKRRTRVIVLTAILAAIVLSIVTLSLGSQDFRQKAFSGPPTSNSLDWSKIDTSIETPEGTVARFVKANAEQDVDAT